MATAPEKEIATDIDEWTKPPFLRRVRIRGYKSIAFCDVSLEPLTVFVGRNASGKSNFIDALAFLGNALRSGATEAINRHGGIPNILCRSIKSPAISFEIETAFSDEAASYLAEYSVTIQANSDCPPVVSQEVLRFKNPTRNLIRQFEAHEGKMEWLGDSVSRRSSTPAQLPPDYLHLGYLGESPFPILANSLRYLGTYNFYPEAIRRLQKVGVGYLLERDGANLASVVTMLQERDSESLERVKAYLRYIAPEIEDFSPIRYGEYETLQFQLRSDTASAPLKFDAASMSDGTLRALAAIVATFQVVFPPGRNNVIAIEEPESALHPAAMRALVAALDEATLRTQILLTTHSPDLLDAAEIKPENVRVVQMIDGRTVIGSVDEASVSIVRDHLSTLGSLERERQLEPDLADLERQAELARQEPTAP